MKITYRFFLVSWDERRESRILFRPSVFKIKNAQKSFYIFKLSQLVLFSGFVYRTKLLCDILHNFCNLPSLLCKKTTVNDATIF